MSCGFFILSLNLIPKVAWVWLMMLVLVVYRTDNILMVYGYLVMVSVGLAWGCCLRCGLIFFPTTVQTNPALGALAAAMVQVGLDYGWVSRVLFIVMGWDAWWPACGAGCVGCVSAKERWD
jgi:hypothetical protein